MPETACNIMTDETKNEEFLGDLKDNAEGDPFAPNTDDPFASSEKEEGQQSEIAVPEKEEEKPLPFHKDPKVQRYLEKEIEKAISNRPEPTQQETQEDYFDEVISSFKTIIGDDTPGKVNALNALKDSLTNLDERAAQKAINRLESVRQEEVAVEQEYENKLTDGFETIEEETGVDLYDPKNKKLKAQFIDFIERVAPKEDGEISDLPDIGETFKAFRSMYKPQTQTPRAKELASKSMERSEGTVTTQKDTGRTTWDNVTEKIKEGLGIG